jgi:hypothetical protein
VEEASVIKSLSRLASSGLNPDILKSELAPPAVNTFKLINPKALDKGP